MAKKKFDSTWEIVYTTKTGRMYVDTGISAKSAAAAKTKFIKFNRASKSFDRIISVTKFR
ncbi:MAG: hypothetical protein PHS33_07960 [Candidatus Omnitrophica bacterium]|nr:hypothetical protein [Candidatus Omnitrophota bacterium]